jgi:hypothetical protein
LSKYDKVSFGVLGAYSLTQNVISKNSLLLGYKVDDKTSVFLRADSEGFRKNPIGWTDCQAYFDNLKLDVVSNQSNNLKFGLEVSYSLYRVSSAFVIRSSARPSSSPSTTSRRKS